MANIKILEIDREPKILTLGQNYHCTWAAKGCIWKLTGFVNSNQVELTTPRSKRKIYAKPSDLRLTESAAVVEAKKRIVKELEKTQLKLAL
jgi:hypothetical protein